MSNDEPIEGLFLLGGACRLPAAAADHPLTSVLIGG